MKVSLIVLLLTTTCCLGKAPPSVVAAMQKTFKEVKYSTVDAMPANLRGALARAFRQRALSIANPNEEIGSSLYRATSDPRSTLPDRRLIFAFRCENLYVVYYEKGHPEGGASPLVFQVGKDGTVKFIWGGVDEASHFAKTPAELKRRIAEGKIRDGLPFYW